MHDDWWLATSFARGDAALPLERVLDHRHPAPGPARSRRSTTSSPTASSARNPVLHALLLAVICAGLGVLVFLVAERLWRTGLAIWIAAVYAVLPNRGSTRLWFAVATYPLAIVLLLLGVLLLLRGRPVLAAVLLAAATLTYEGVFGLALLAVATWSPGRSRQALAGRGRRGRGGRRLGRLPLPDLTEAQRRHDTSAGVNRLMSSQFGVGIFESGARVAQLAPAALALGLTLIDGAPLPRAATCYRRVVPAGVVLVLAGWLPVLPHQLAGRDRRLLRPGQRCRRTRDRGAARAPCSPGSST